MNAESPKFCVTAKIYCGDNVAVGPDQARLLEAIQHEGSISAAGRALGISYRKTWMMVDEMNRCWRSALVVTSAGGARGGGARLSQQGLSVLAHYRDMQRLLDAASKGQSLAALLDDVLASPRV